MTTVSTLPAAPSRNSPSDFATKADAWVAAIGTWTTEVNTVAGEVNTNATTASTAASTATTQANNASTSATTASNWAIKTDGPVSGGEYSAKHHAQQAATSASSALTSKNEAEAIVEKYQGELSSDPALDKTGGPITAGDWYVNTTTGLIRAYNGTNWVNSTNVSAGVSSINLQQGGLTLKTINNESLLGVGNISIIPDVQMILKPSLVSPANAATNVKPGNILQVTEGLTAYSAAVTTKIQFSKFSDFSVIYSETSWLIGTAGTVNYTLLESNIEEGSVGFFWRAISRTTVQGVEYQSAFSDSRSFTTAISFYDIGTDIDNLSNLVTIQSEWNAGTTYSTGQVVIVRTGPRRFIEYSSLTNGNIGNNPASSPTHWQQIYDNNVNTSGYFGEVLGSACVVDKGEWLSTTAYSIGDMVVVRNISTPLKQSDLTAYVAKTANTNKPPASNPADWQQRNALPTGTSLAQTLGIGNTTPEVLINNGSGWLKFVHQGKIKYIAKKPFMHTVSWDDIAKAEAVYGNRTVRIGSRLYRVSLLSGAEADPSSWTTSSTATDNKGAGSEWNALVYRVHTDVPTDGASTDHGGKQVGSNWMNFSNADMVMTSAAGNGSYTWCKETLSFNTAFRVFRGFGSLSGFGITASSGTNANFGWRPCLTLISEPEADSTLYNAEASGVGPSVASLQYDPITDTGYYGEVTSGQFYTGTQISTATAVTSGTLQNDNEGWLKFYWHGQVLFIAKKTYRYGLSWDNINTANAIYGVNLGSTGKKTITHSGSSTSYDVKLMKGATKDPSPASSPGRQWNELLYRVCTGTETGEIGNNWATLNPSTDLGINSGNGGYAWCQEVYQPNTAGRVIRGYGSLSYFTYSTSSATDTTFGWRPCLALVR